MHYFNRLSCLMIIASACAFFAGCFAFVSPVPTPTQVKDVHGSKMSKHLGIRAIKPGATRRGEILQKLSRTDAGLHNKRMFLARWKVSHMAVCWAADGGGGGEGEAGCRRLWRAHNLMLEFDRQGVVRKVRRVGDHDIGKLLTAWVATDPDPPLNLSHLIQVPFFKGRRSGKLNLGRDLLGYQDNLRRSKSVQVPRRQILDVRTLGWKGPSSYSIRVEIQYRKGPKTTKKLKFRMSPSHLLTLIDYVEQTRAEEPSVPVIPVTDKR